MSTPFQQNWKRFIRKPSGIIGLIICLFFLLVVIFADILATHDPFEGDLSLRMQAPSAEHYFGTDEMGRDIYSRVIHGARITLNVGITAVLIALIIGIPLALLAVSGGKKIDIAITGLIDIMLSFPSIVMALAIVAILGQSLQNAMIAIGIVYAPRFARVIRSAAITEIQRDYVSAARALNCSMGKILFRHVLPNCLPVILVTSTQHLAYAILEAAALSFLGLGAQPPSPEWGAMLFLSRRYFMQNASMMYYPGIAIFLVVLGINLLGDALNEAFSGR